MAAVKRGFAEISQGQLHFRFAAPACAASKPPLLMFPGAAESTFTLQRLLARMGDQRSVFAFDALGQGDSSPPAGPDVTLDYFVDAVRQALNALGLDGPLDVMGIHAGARLAAELAIGQPSRIRKLILDGIRVGRTDYWSGYAKQLDFSRYIDQEGTQFIKTFNKRRDSYLFDPYHKRSAENWRGCGLPPAEEMHDSALERFKNIKAGHIFYRLAVLYPAEQRLPLLRTPTLFISTPKDDRFNDLVRVSALVEHAQSALYPNDETLEQSSDAAIAALCDLLTAWLDRDDAKCSADGNRR